MACSRTNISIPLISINARNFDVTHHGLSRHTYYVCRYLHLLVQSPFKFHLVSLRRHQLDGCRTSKLPWSPWVRCYRTDNGSPCATLAAPVSLDRSCKYAHPRLSQNNPSSLSLDTTETLCASLASLQRRRSRWNFRRLPGINRRLRTAEYRRYNRENDCFVHVSLCSAVLAPPGIPGFSLGT